MMEEHYGQHKNRPFYDELIEFMTSSPVIPMVWEGKNVVKITRKMLGKSEPELSMSGTIRADFCVDINRNVIHGSHSIEAAQKEINIWFQPNEIISWTSADDRWVYLAINWYRILYRLFVILPNNISKDVESRETEESFYW